MISFMQEGIVNLMNLKNKIRIKPEIVYPCLYCNCVFTRKRWIKYHLTNAHKVNNSIKLIFNKAGLADISTTKDTSEYES